MQAIQAKPKRIERLQLCVQVSEPSTDRFVFTGARTTAPGLALEWEQSAAHACGECKASGAPNFLCLTALCNPIRRMHVTCVQDAASADTRKRLSLTQLWQSPNFLPYNSS